jgi:hypothetical protein
VPKVQPNSAAVLPDRLRSAAQRRDVSWWVEALGAPEQAPTAYAALKALPEARLRTAALPGLNHPNSRVRRSCCRLLGDLALTPGSTAALERCLDDPHPLCGGRQCTRCPASTASRTVARSTSSPCSSACRGGCWSPICVVTRADAGSPRARSRSSLAGPGSGSPFLKQDTRRSSKGRTTE